MSLLDLVEAILREAPLCDSCLGRCFARLGGAMSNRDRGVALKVALAVEADQLREAGDPRGDEIMRALARSGFKQAMKRLGVERPEPCYVCGGLMDSVSDMAARIAEALKPYEFNTFLVGTRVPGSIVEREDALRAKFSLSYGESLKSDLNRELRRALAARLRKKVDFNSPDVLVIMDLVNDRVEVKPSPVFIYGRYRKLEAGIPQNKWLCSRCWGAGCERCGWTGKMYPTSIEELVAAPMAEMFEGREAKFHGAGREDVDVKVVGRGRPFVVEVKEPRRRFLDLSMVEAKVNEVAQGKVEVHELRYTNREEVRRLKMMAPLREKVYLARVKVHGGYADEDLRRVEEALRGATIRQRTPTRVLHRRADKVRHKKVYDVEARRLTDDEMELKIRSQGGLYIKELITGDHGRTTPSVAEVLGRDVEVEELTVIDVE